MEVLQYRCANCDRTHSQTFDFVESGKSHTKGQSKWIFKLSAKQSHSEVGSLLDIHSKTVERIFNEEAKKELGLPDWHKIKCIGIDEYAFNMTNFDHFEVELSSIVTFPLPPKNHPQNSSKILNTKDKGKRIHESQTKVLFG